MLAARGDCLVLENLGKEGRKYHKNERIAANPCGHRPFSLGHFVKRSTHPAERAKKWHLNVRSVGLRGWLLPMLADVSLTARQLVLRVPSHFTILVGEEGKSHLGGVHGAPFLVCTKRIFTDPGLAHDGAEGNGYLSVRSPPEAVGCASALTV